MPPSNLTFEIEVGSTSTELKIKKGGQQQHFSYEANYITFVEATLTTFSLDEFKLALAEFRSWIGLLLRKYGAVLGAEIVEELRKGRSGDIALLGFVRNGNLTTVSANLPTEVVTLTASVTPVTFPLAGFARTNYELIKWASEGYSLAVSLDEVSKFFLKELK